MKNIIAFLNGMREFRLSFTTLYTDDALNDAYDHGRDFAHTISLRGFES